MAAKPFKSMYLYTYLQALVGLELELSIKRSAGVAQEVNRRYPLHSGDEVCKRGIQPGFETKGGCLQNGPLQKDSYPPKIKKKELKV